MNTDEQSQQPTATDVKSLSEKLTAFTRTLTPNEARLLVAAVRGGEVTGYDDYLLDPYATNWAGLVSDNGGGIVSTYGNGLFSEYGVG